MANNNNDPLDIAGRLVRGLGGMAISGVQHGARGLLRVGTAAARLAVDAGTARPGQEQEAKDRAFLNDSLLNDKATWFGVKILGRGGQGVAGLWLKLDRNRRILDRMVVKEAIIRDDKWHGPNMWSFPGVWKRCPRDAAIHGILSPGGALAEKGGASNNASEGRKRKRVGTGTGIVGLRSQKVFPRTLSYRLYLDFASHGDLADILSGHKWPQWVPETRPNGTIVKKSVSHGPLPETFIWFVFYHLMLACRQMEHVKHKNYKGYVVHQDLKPGNVFLDAPDPEWFPNFPIPKMGDFGSARLTNDADPGNPSDWLCLDAKTRGYCPVEYRNEAEGHTAHVAAQMWATRKPFSWEPPGANDLTSAPQRPRLTSSVNIWQCAMTIRVIMQLKNPNFNHNTDDVPTMNTFADQYSDLLIQTITKCLSNVPGDRPSSQHILDLIESKFDQLFPADGPEPDLKRYKLPTGERANPYKVGMILSQSAGGPPPNPSGMSNSGELASVPSDL